MYDLSGQKRVLQESIVQYDYELRQGKGIAKEASETGGGGTLRWGFYRDKVDPHP